MNKVVRWTCVALTFSSKLCKNFDAETYEIHVYTELLPSTCDIHDDTDLFKALKKLKKKTLPLYRLKNEKNRHRGTAW